MNVSVPLGQSALVNDVTMQLTPQLARRLSRGSTSQSGRYCSRVEKPRSTHASPRTLERRKTTSGVKRLATLDDHFNMMFGVSHGEEEAIEQKKESSRPLSWHPSSNQFHVPPRSSILEPSPAQITSNWPPHASESSRHSSFESDYPSISARSSVHPDQAQHVSGLLNDCVPMSGESYFSDASWSEAPRATRPTSYALSSYSTPAIEPASWHVQNWFRSAQGQCETSRAGSSEFLPIQYPTDENDAASNADVDMEDSGKELVGMGLYDPPTGGLLLGAGKSLKLAETWQPPEPEEDADEDADADADADASSVDESVDESPAKETEQWPALDTKQVPTSLEGQSFFFDEDETYTKEWWFQQLKQPTVRDAGLGYGWL